MKGASKTKILAAKRRKFLAHGCINGPACDRIGHGRGIRESDCLDQHSRIYRVVEVTRRQSDTNGHQRRIVTEAVGEPDAIVLRCLRRCGCARNHTRGAVDGETRGQRIGRINTNHGIPVNH